MEFPEYNVILRPVINSIDIANGLIVIHSDGKVTGEIDQAAPAAKAFVEALEDELQSLIVSNSALARAWDDGFDTALDDVGASVVMSEHGEDLNPFRKKV